MQNMRYVVKCDGEIVCEREYNPDFEAATYSMCNDKVYTITDTLTDSIIAVFEGGNEVNYNEE